MRCCRMVAGLSVLRASVLNATYWRALCDDVLAWLGTSDTSRAPGGGRDGSAQANMAVEAIDEKEYFGSELPR